jgi:benzoate/toluate 1,2-dioxygenase alpha subunit
VHWNYAATTARRGADGKVDNLKAMNAGAWAKQGGGFYSFKHGHMLLWTNWSNPEDRPLWPRRPEWVEKFGEARADWMLRKSRNLCLYPNVYLMDQFSSQIRVVRPISVNKSEATIYCIAPKGEPAEARERRLRQYEDFFNATGMATPDDLEEFRSCQHGFEARACKWNDMSRGSLHWVKGADENAKLIGLEPELSGLKTEDEGLYTMQHKYWLEEMKKAVLAEQQATGA